MKPVDSQFLQTIDQLTSSIHAYGIPLPRRGLHAHNLLEEIPIEIKEQVTNALDGYRQLIDPPTDITRPVKERNRELDLAHFDIFMKVACMRLADPNFMVGFEEGDICEVYSANHQQLFRNLEFFRQCSYDLYTLTVTPWHLLFKRQESVHQQLVNLAEYVFMKAVPIVTNPVPPHILQECYEGHSKSFLYTIKQVGCLLDTFTNEPKGYLTIIKVQEVAPGETLGLVN